jgi:hypothetical protein
MKTTYYEPGNMTRYEIASNKDGDGTCFVWWTKRSGGKTGIAVTVGPGEYCHPDKIYAAVPQGADREKALWVEDCRVVAYYINCATLADPEKHRCFNKEDLPAWAWKTSSESRQQAVRSIKEKL